MILLNSGTPGDIRIHLLTKSIPKRITVIGRKFGQEIKEIQLKSKAKYIGIYGFNKTKEEIINDIKKEGDPFNGYYYYIIQSILYSIGLYFFSDSFFKVILKLYHSF